MKVTVTGLFLAGLCGSAFAAPVSVDANVDATVGSDVNADVNANINTERGLKTEVEVEAEVEARDVLGSTVETVTNTVNGLTGGNVANVNGLEKDINGVVGQATGGLNLRGNDEATVLIKGGKLLGTDGKITLDVRSALDAASVDMLTAQVQELVQKLENTAGVAVRGEEIKANVAAGSAGNADVDATLDVLRRSLLPEGSVQSTVDGADSTVNSATGVDAMDTVNSISPQVKQLVDELIAKLDATTNGLNVRDIIGGVTDDVESTVQSATGVDAMNTVNQLTPEVKQLVNQLSAALQSAGSGLSVRDVVGGVTDNVESTVQSATGVDAMDTVNSLTPEVKQLVNQLTAVLQSKGLSVRDLVGGVTDNVESTVQSATGVDTMNTVNSLTPEVKQLINQLTAALQSTGSGLSVRDLVDGVTDNVESTVESATGVDAMNTVNSLTPEVKQLVNQLTAVLQSKGLSVRDIVGGVTDSVESTVESATGVDANKVVDTVNVSNLEAQLQAILQKIGAGNVAGNL